jgi:cardiolipin synthase
MNEHSVSAFFHEKFFSCVFEKTGILLDKKGEVNMIYFILSLLALIIFFVSLDFYLGRRKHLKEHLAMDFPVRHSDCHLLSEGSRFFSSFFDDIERATHHIHIQFYIFRDDKIGKEAIDRLAQKVKEGIEVRVLVDYVGSYKLRKKVRKFKEAGIELAFMNKPKFPYFFYSLNRRNHRKITVIDGKTAYIGGFNVGDEYLGQNPKLGDWRDYHIRMTGESVQDLHSIFIKDWNKSYGDELSLQTYETALFEGMFETKVIPTDGKSMHDFFLKHINKARSTIFIGTPYFIPGKNIKRALINAVKRGVHVTILLPAKGDHPFVREAAIPYLYSLLKSGCSIFRFYQGFYHSKVFIIDDTFCDIGTANFDKRSFHLNNEVNCLVFSKSFIATVQGVIDIDIQRSEQLTLPQLQGRSTLERGKELFATTISRLL